MERIKRRIVIGEDRELTSTSIEKLIELNPLPKKKVKKKKDRTVHIMSETSDPEIARTMCRQLITRRGQPSNSGVSVTGSFYQEKEDSIRKSCERLARSVTTNHFSSDYETAVKMAGERLLNACIVSGMTHAEVQTICLHMQNVHPSFYLSALETLGNAFSMTVGEKEAVALDGIYQDVVRRC